MVGVFASSVILGHSGLLAILLFLAVSAVLGIFATLVKLDILGNLTVWVILTMLAVLVNLVIFAILTHLPNLVCFAILFNLVILSNLSFLFKLTFEAVSANFVAFVVLPISDFFNSGLWTIQAIFARLVLFAILVFIANQDNSDILTVLVDSTILVLLEFFAVLAMSAIPVSLAILPIWRSSPF